LPEGGIYFQSGGCSTQSLNSNFTVTMGGNTIYIKGKQVGTRVKRFSKWAWQPSHSLHHLSAILQPGVSCGDVTTWAEWQAKAGTVDAGTTVQDAITADEIIAMATKLLSMSR
jgi:hypothetical protein